ncbi:MAG: metallophosphoesterase [bacterium]|nr:metallophosphoesterase [bacterium]
MLVGIMSDTHDHMGKIRRAVAEMRAAGVEVVLHAGDFISPLTFDCMKDLGVPLHGVYGNNDGETLLLQERYAAIGGLHARFFKIRLDGLRFIVTHDDTVVDSLARSGDYDVVVYGHTHRVDVRKVGGTDVINPGEVCGYCTGRSTVVVYDTGLRASRVIELD